MTWSATILRGNDDLDVKPFEPVTSNGMVLVDDGGEADVTSQIVLRKLASLDTDLGIGIMEGAVVKLWNGSRVGLRYALPSLRRDARAGDLVC
jgi:hypothetical protein